MVIPVTILIALGVDHLISKLKTSAHFIAGIIILSAIFLEYLFYLDNYYIHLSVHYARDTHVVEKKVSDMIATYGKDYSDVWITKSFGGYIHLLFHLKYPPEVYQKELQLGLTDEYGFSFAQRFGKYKFDKIPKYFDLTKNTLYVVRSDEYRRKNLRPIARVKYPDGQDAYLLFDTDTIRKFCSECGLDHKPLNEDIYGNLTEALE